MLTAIVLSLILTFLTLLSTSFHLTNLSLIFLLIISIFTKRNFIYLVLLEVLLLFLFGGLNLGPSILLVTISVGLFKIGQENIFPGRKISSFLIALIILVIWEIVNGVGAL